MEFVNIYDAKTNLSKFIDKVNKDHISIVICKNGVPVGQLTEYKYNNIKTIGLLKDRIKITDDFNEELPDLIMKGYK